MSLQRRNDREEIRRRLAMGVEAEEGQEADKQGKKPSLQSRLQSGQYAKKATKYVIVD